jgi:uncharacterized alkaline shock family protein YloU
MAALHNPNDTVTIAPGVLLSIVRMATLSVESVVRTTHTSGSMDRWFRRAAHDDGIRIDVTDEGVRVDVYLMVDAAQSLLNTSRKVQEEVARTIKEFVGMKVSAVNVHIEDIVFSRL